MAQVRVLGTVMSQGGCSSSCITTVLYRCDCMLAVYYRWRYMAAVLSSEPVWLLCCLWEAVWLS